MVRFEIPRLMDNKYPPMGSVDVSLKGLRIPYGSQQVELPANELASTRPIGGPGILIDSDIVLHSAVPFTLEDLQANVRSKRIYIANAWGMTVPSDIDVSMDAHDNILITSPEHELWPWMLEFFTAHGTDTRPSPMRITEQWGPGVKKRPEYGNWLWYQGQPTKKVNIVPMVGRQIEFGHRPYRKNQRNLILDGKGSSEENTSPSRMFIFHAVSPTTDQRHS